MDPHGGGGGVSLGEKTKADEKDMEMKDAKSLEEPKAKEGKVQGDKMQIDSKEVKKPVPAEGLAKKKEGGSLESHLSYVTA